MRILTTEQMKREETLSDEMGVTFCRLMENAGCAAASFIRQNVSTLVSRNIMVFCGSGNNGGDGFVAARKLFEEGANVIVVLCAGEPKSEEAKYMYGTILEAGFTILDFSADRKKIDECLAGVEIMIDAVFGTGFHGEFREPFGEIAEIMNCSEALKISLDIPSGVDAKTGFAAKGAVKANLTVAFDALKPGHLLLPGREFCGKTTDVDIGIPHEVREQIQQSCFCTDDSMIFSSVRRRALNSHKGTYGKLLCITGSRLYPGAAAISAMGALRCGAGIVTVASTERVITLMASRIPEATFIPLPENEQGSISAEAAEMLLPLLKSYDAVLIGCGLSKNEDIAKLTEFVIRNAEGRIIIDADALNCIAGGAEILNEAKKTPVITPHMGEMARLCGISTDEIASERLSTATEAAKKFGAVTVLKDSSTVIAAPNGDIYFNTTGNPGLSKGGSGDCLAGMIAAFAAQGFIETACAVCGVYIHGLAADKAAEKLSTYGMLPTDIPTAVCSVFAEHGL